MKKARLDEFCFAEKGSGNEVVFIDAASYETLLRQGFRGHQFRGEQLARVDGVAGESDAVELSSGHQAAAGELGAVDRLGEEAVSGELRSGDDVRARVAAVEESREHSDEVNVREGLRIELSLCDESGIDQLLARDEIERQQLAAGDGRVDQSRVDERLSGGEARIQ